jgi:hypothetical protein
MTRISRLARVLAGTLVAAALGMAAVPAGASHVGDDLVVDQQVVSSTDRLLGALRLYEAAAPAARAARAAQVTQLAQQRRARLLHLLEHNPRLAAARLMPPELRERLPEAARAFVEQEVQLDGNVFAKVADDFERGVSRSVLQLQTSPSAAVLTLHLADPTGQERDRLGWVGRRVSLSGAQLDGHVVIRQKADVQLLAAEGTTSSGGTSTPTITPVVTGDQRTLVILANFSDAALTCSATDVNARLFGATGSTVNTAFRESSRNLVSFSGQVVGPYPIPYTASGSCDYSGWASAADAAARAAGVDPSQYRRVNYVTPRNANCGWSGLAYMPGTRSWVQSCGSTGIFTHELGHNLSLHHAATPTAEYGDGSDPMGGARNVRNNAANQVMAGWVPTGEVVDVFAGGSYAVGALGPASVGAPQVLRMAKPDTAESYYVSLRQATGLDASLPSTALNAVSIHRAAGRLPAKTYLLQYLAVGQTFTDAVNGIQVTNQGVGNGVATVAVSFNGATCERSAPGVTLTPASRTASPGATVSYTVTVANRNTAACGTSTFALSQALPGGFGGVFSSASLAIAAGGSASATWSVTSNTAVADATYTLDATASDTAGGSAPTTAHASYVAYRDTDAPALTITSPADGALLSGRSVTLAATASDASGISAVEFYVGDKLLGRDGSAPYSVNWNLRKSAKGQHIVRVRAFDAAGNVAEQAVTVSVQ